MAIQALGKGLSALLENDRPTLHQEQEQGAQVTMLPPAQLRAGPYQPREFFDQDKLNELAESIRENGVIQPIIARPTERGGIYQIIAGERRWRACKQLGLNEVPVIIRSVNDKQALELAIIENIQRQNLSPIEEADGYKRLQQEFNYTQEHLAKNLGRSRSHIANMLRLLDLPEDVKAYLHSGELTPGHARAIITSNNPSELAKEIVENKLSVRQAEKFAAGYGTHQLNDSQITDAAEIKDRKRSANKNKPEKDEDLASLEYNLSKKLGLKVLIEQSASGGKLTINFNSLAQLDKIIQSLN